MADRTKKRKPSSSRARPNEEDPMSEAGHIQTAVRITAPTVKRLDDLAKSMSRPGLTVSRSEAVRVALLQGLDSLEASRRP